MAEEISDVEVQQIVEERCLFCNIVKKRVPAFVIHEDANHIAFLDIGPCNPGHTLVIPKMHYAILPQMPDEEVGALFRFVKKIASAVFEATGAEGIQIRQNNGRAAGQEIPHVYVHIMPRFIDDGVINNWEPRKLAKEQFEEIQKQIIHQLEGRKDKEEGSKKPDKLEPEVPAEEIPKEESLPEPKKEKIIRMKPRIP